MISGAVKNLIFDLGGVIINLEIENTIQAFADLGRVSREEVLNAMHAKPFFMDYEKGLISTPQFRNCLRQWINAQVSDDQLDDAWNAMLLDIPKERILLLQQLQSRYRMFLLSNTNELHLSCFAEIVKSVTGHASLNPYFNKVYYSHEVRMRKPERAIYEHLISENELVPAETFFMDDNLINLEGARQLGIQTFHVQKPDQLFNLFA